MRFVATDVPVRRVWFTKLLVSSFGNVFVSE